MITTMLFDYELRGKNFKIKKLKQKLRHEVVEAKAIQTVAYTGFWKGGAENLGVIKTKKKGRHSDLARFSAQI